MSEEKRTVRNFYIPSDDPDVEITQVIWYSPSEVFISQKCYGEKSRRSFVFTDKMARDLVEALGKFLKRGE